MIEYKSGNILDADTDALVNTVNCVGVMGRGIALQFKNAFPDNFQAYAAACDREMVVPGKMFVFETGKLSPRYIINFPTKRHWRGKSRMQDIDNGLADLVKVVRHLRLTSIAIPPLGSGLGGLDWSEVRPRIVAALEDLPSVRAVIYEPSGAPASQALARNKPVPSMTAGRAALVILLRRYLAGLMDPFVSLLEAHKLMFFMQEAGQPLRLQFRKGNYGPYAENLRHVLHAVEGHLIAGYGDGGDDPTKPLSLVPGAVEDAENYLVDDEATRSRFDRVAALVGGFETPYGLELLATVYWVVHEEGAIGMPAIRDAVHRWNKRKQQFTEGQIELAYRQLLANGWVTDKADLPKPRHSEVEVRAAATA